MLIDTSFDFRVDARGKDPDSHSRYYRHEDSPLAPALGRYAGFFALFEDFQGYVDFFLLQDLVSADCEAVRFFMPFTDFSPPAIPRDLDTCLLYTSDAADDLLCVDLGGR